MAAKFTIIYYLFLKEHQNTYHIKVILIKCKQISEQNIIIFANRQIV